MKKVSLITLHSVQNYGSALQTYATQTLFEGMGAEVLVTDFVRENNLKNNLVDTGIKNSRLWNKNAATRFLFRALKANDLEKRYDLFDEFIRKNIHITEHRYLCDADFEKYPIDADIYCTGSDQTWNSYWNRGLIRPFFLSYAKKGKKKIAYGASFGKNKLDENEKPEIKQLLKDYSAITVRENEAVEILKDLDIQAKQVLDPTLMLTGEQWKRFAAPPALRDKYILIYQLHHDEKFNSLAKKIAKHKKLKLVRIGFGNEAYFYGGSVVKNPTVTEFLSLLAHAEYVITDSFHATSFSINMNVNFFTYLPKKFSGRITDILGIFGLSDRIFADFETLKKCADTKIDFTPVNAELAAQRKRSYDIVKGMLE